MQVAEFGYPFPAKIFEKELFEQGIQFREIEKNNSEGGFSSAIYYVSLKDVEKTIQIRSNVERENGQSEENFRHPILKILAYLGLFFILGYATYRYFEIFRE